MSKIIINNKSHLDDINALVAVMSVLGEGKISNDGKQHCYVSTITLVGEVEVTVHTTLNKDSETFRVF